MKWKTSRAVKDSIGPRCRILALADEVEDSLPAFRTVLRRAFRKLPPYKRIRGVIGVVLKDDPFVIHDEDSGRALRLRNVGFFHVPSLRAWASLYGGSIDGMSVPGPLDWPDSIGPGK